MVVRNLSSELPRSPNAVRLESMERVLLVFLDGVLLTDFAQGLVVLVDELLVDDDFLR